MVLFVIGIYIMLGYLSLRPLYKQKKIKDLIATAILTGLSFLIAVLLSLGVDIPSPAKPLENIISMFIGKK